MAEAERIRRFLAFPDKQCCALDPCIGEGAAFAEIVSDRRVLRYGVELDCGRANEARGKGIEVIHGNCFDVQCPVESFSLVYLNPPYDFEIGEERSQRMELLFLEHVYRWLRRGGVLVMVIPGRYIHDCSQILAHQFRDVRVYRLTEAECVKYKQIVAMGVRRTRAERDRVQDAEIKRARMRFESLSTDLERISPLRVDTELRIGRNTED
jgi:16S rRNA G966 N2-methylase RsmD